MLNNYSNFKTLKAMSFRGFLFGLKRFYVLADILSETIFNLIVIDE